MALVDLHSNGFKGTPGCIANSTAFMQGFGATGLVRKGIQSHMRLCL
jgi:hypothetical protein